MFLRSQEKYGIKYTYIKDGRNIIFINILNVNPYDDDKSKVLITSEKE